LRGLFCHNTQAERAKFVCDVIQIWSNHLKIRVRNVTAYFHPLPLGHKNLIGADEWQAAAMYLV
jgi:hypothetical protein